MIYANFGEEERTLWIRGLTQWDYGRVLKISGLNLAGDSIQVHFANEGCGEALVQLGAVDKSGNITVKIPNELLKNGRDINAYVYLADKEFGKTIREIWIAVKPRPKPKDYEEVEDQHTLEQLLEAINKKADGLALKDVDLQLTSEGTPIGEAVALPTGGSADVNPITIPEIDEIMKGD